VVTVQNEAEDDDGGGGGIPGFELIFLDVALSLYGYGFDKEEKES